MIAPKHPPAIPSMTITSCGTAKETARALVAMAIQRGLKPHDDDLFVAWIDQTLRNELARRRGGEMR